jgi:hypothetical protein
VGGAVKAMSTSSSVLDWSDLCSQQIVWNQMTSRDPYGKPIYEGLSQYFIGRRVFKYSRVASYERGTKGQGPENISESTIWILGTPNVQYEDQLLVAGDFAPLWFAATLYEVDATVLDSSGHIQTCIVAGLSGLNPPTWNDNGFATADGNGSPPLTWQDSGPAPIPAILSVQNTPDEQGSLFVKVMLGSSNG